MFSRLDRDNKPHPCARMSTNLFEALVDFVENTSLVEHLSAVTMFVVVGDVVAQLARQLAIDHVLFDLLELQHRSCSVAGEEK